MAFASKRYLLNKGEIDKAIKLVVRVYQKEGYFTPENSRGARMRIKKFLSLPASATFGITAGESLIGTASVIMDNTEGLPMDELYREELDVFRRQNKKIAEVGQFAVDKELINSKRQAGENINGLLVPLVLFRCVFKHGIDEDVDIFCVTVNPKHEHFYEQLGFKKIGLQKQYSSVNNAPAQAEILHIKTVISKYKNKKTEKGFAAQILHGVIDD